MSPAAIIERLHGAELHHKDFLFGLLGSLKSSKGSTDRLPAITRGLCTHNQKLLAVMHPFLPDSTDAPDGDLDTLKDCVNEWLLWFEESFVVFEKYAAAVAPARFISDPAARVPLLHCTHYVAFIDALAAVLRNPFVLDRLHDAKARIALLLELSLASEEEARLNNISFDRVKGFESLNVSCFFTTDQIVRRTKNIPLFMGSTRAEFVLLALSHQKQHGDYDALAILEVAPGSDARAVLYPPFRVNELSMSLSYDCINFAPFVPHKGTGRTVISVTGSSKVIETWFALLLKIFPTDDKLVTSDNIQLVGLGINTYLDDSGSASPALSASSHCEALSQVSALSHASRQEQPAKESKSRDSPKPESFARPCITSETSRASSDSNRSLEIMRKLLSNDGIEQEHITSHLLVVERRQPRDSVPTVYDYDDHGDDSSAIDSLDCFEIVNPKQQPKPLNTAAIAAQSLPDLRMPEPFAPMYTNAAGSAVDVKNFGKSHNPSFAKVEANKKNRRMSFFGLFKRKPKTNSSAETTQPQTSLTDITSLEHKVEDDQLPANLQTDTIAQTEIIPQVEQTAQRNATSQIETSPKAKKRPDLQIEIPRHSQVDTSSLPASATTRTLPLPFALPSSSSMYFFKPYLQNNRSAATLDGTSSGVAVKEEQTLQIPPEFKEIINSDDTIDFYLSPSAPESIKVSQWKPKYGKWELLTSNECVFVKIAVNYELSKSWLLVFKEEYDAEFDEVVDKPVLVLNLDEDTKLRQLTALDIEISSTNTFTAAKQMIIVRCYDSSLVADIKTNLDNLLSVIRSKRTLSASATHSLSLLSKPSASSTLTSIYTHLDVTAASSLSDLEIDDRVESDRLLLDRMTVKVHMQMESYEHVHQLSSWKSLAMCSLSVLHSVDGNKEGTYHLELRLLEDGGDEDPESFDWKFSDANILDCIERIGKAGLLVKVAEDEIYMLECKGKKELKKLVALF